MFFKVLQNLLHIYYNRQGCVRTVAAITFALLAFLQ